MDGKILHIFSHSTKFGFKVGNVFKESNKELVVLLLQKFLD